MKILNCILLGLIPALQLSAARPVAKIAAEEEKPIVVVLSMDAFRWDYPQMAHTPTLDSLRRAGASAVTYPCFPANTFPNHYAMATGLQPDHHGIVENNFYDKQMNAWYSLKDSASINDPAFWHGEPIWMTAEKQGIRSAVYFWVGSETPGHRSSIWKKFDGSVTYKQRADSVLSWLSLPEEKLPRLIMWYIEDPDATAHTYGPTAPETIAQVERLDSLLGYFFREVRKTEPYRRINFIVTADHGMVQLAPERYVNLYKILDPKRIKYKTGGIPLQLAPDPDYLDEAYAVLKTVPHIQVWKRDKMPRKYRYGTDTMRIEPLIILPDAGYRADFRKTDRLPQGGNHGFDPFLPDMKTIFFASGPAFKENYRAKSFQNLNLYVLVAELLGIEPAPNDGNIRNVKKMLRKSPAVPETTR